MSKIYKMVNCINKKCIAKNIFYYHKLYFILATYEALLVLYLIEGAIILRLFQHGSLENQKDILVATILIFAPIAIAFIFCIVYLYITSYIITKRIKICAELNEIFTKKNANKRMYECLEHSFNSTLSKIHISGSICYMIASLIIVIIYFMLGYKDVKTAIFIFLFGTFSGIAWNILDYHRDKQIKLGELIKNYNPSCKHIDMKKKFKYFIGTFIYNSILVLIIAIIGVYIIFNIASHLNKVIDLQVFYILISIFLGIFIFYVRTILVFFYIKPKIHYSFSEYKDHK